MIDLIIHWLVATVAVLVTTYLLPGVVIDSIWTAGVVAIVIAAINLFVRPLIIVLTLPINIMTLGLLTLVINALLIMLVDWIVPGFTVANFWWALLFGIILVIIEWTLGLFAKPTKINKK